MSGHQDQIEYLVGQEHDIPALLKSPEIAALVRGAGCIGAVCAAVVDNDGFTVCSAGDTSKKGLHGVVLPLCIEGEKVAELHVSGETGDRIVEGVAAMLCSAVTVVLNNNLKRMMTAKVHTSVVTKTYDELLEKNRQLSVSAAEYRELAENLEVKVQERTAELGLVHSRLLQQEKLAAVGQLAAGVAHEINNPVAFINSNLYTLKKYLERLCSMLDWYSGRTAADDGICNEAHLKQEELRIGLVRGDVWDLLDQSLTGTERIRKIVADLKGVSHLDEIPGESFDLRLEVDRTLAVIHRQLPSDATVQCELTNTPPVRGNGALFCQALFNMIQNSVQAAPSPLVLQFKSSLDADRIRFSISDNGHGVPEVIRGRIFEPFFTTRDVGEGTGMGLAVVYDIIVNNCHGCISVGAAPGGGALFEIEFPLSADQGD